MSAPFSFGTTGNPSMLDEQQRQPVAQTMAAPPMLPKPENPAIQDSGDPKLDAWLRQMESQADYPLSQRTGKFLAGPHKGKTPGQLREFLVSEYNAGRATPTGILGRGAAGGLVTGTMTGGNSFTPTAQWKAATQPGQIARPRASSLSPATMAAPAKVAPKPGNAMFVGPVKPSNPAVATLKSKPTQKPFDFFNISKKPSLSPAA